MAENKKSGADFPLQKNNQILATKKTDVAEREERVLRFWQTNQIFEKTLSKKSPKGEFLFYDGPPFATGTPHYGHVLAGTMKDVIPRYKTMRGYHVERKWGWDCHGLPIENLIQKENNLKTKKDIEAFGVKNFNQSAKASVFRYDSYWRKIVPRTGRWVDMDDQYTTMDHKFMESVWWGFSELYKKGLVYENFRSMHISPPLETPLSNFEVNLDYRDITDISVYVKFQLPKSDSLAQSNQKVSLVAWTTTPWTLYGNVALAVGKNITYSKIKVQDDDGSEEFLIVAKDKADQVLADRPHEKVAEFLGADLVGKSYTPLFDHYSKDKNLENHNNGWKVYDADFVTTEDGTGIVHIAPAFGEDDLILGQEKKLPFVQHVNIDGTIKSEITELAGRQAKPISTKEEPNKHQETDIEVMKILASQRSLLKREKYLHSYPHCWRTGAPLLNYALSSWFIKVSDFKDKLVALNKDINWVPEAVGKKRFGNWLENAKDWGVSRSRFWGTPIPIWRSEDGSEIDILSSVEDIKNKTRSTNKYFLARHGEADHNVKNFLSADNTSVSNLTEKGLKEARATAKKLRSEKIDLIFCSPLIRTRKTAEIIAEAIGFNKNQIVFDDRITETQTGVLNGQPEEELKKLFKTPMDRFTIAPEGGETVADIRRRVGDFIYDIDSKYENKNILIVTHEYPTWAFMAVKDGLNNKEMAEIKKAGIDFVPTGNLVEYDFAPIPHDDDYILDLHRPYVDEIKYQKNGKEMIRVADIFDGWIDSGSMPFAVPHYPFEKKMSPGGFLRSTKNFPADFIAEGLDQTRGWFYTLLVLSAALFNKSPFKNVIVNGLVLAEDGQKMSKSLNNYPDPELVINKHGADALRYYLISSQLVQAEPLNFSEKGVDEVNKKIIQRFLNVLSFYELYRDQDLIQQEIARPTSQNPLDLWILARLDQVYQETTKELDAYRLDSASRPFFDFVDDLSTWYLRRSRDRIKSDNEIEKQQTLQTLAYVLLEFSKIVSPFMPFLSEAVYQRVTNLNYQKKDFSVHLLDWPESRKVNQEILDSMYRVRQIVTLALEKRSKSGIKVRQPLQKIIIGVSFEEELKRIISDEVNVKEIVLGENFKPDQVELDTNITEDLRQEGNARELIRFIQTYRKEINLHPGDKIKIQVKTTDKKLIQKFSEYIKKITNASQIELFDKEEGKDFEINKVKFFIKIRK